MSVDPAARRCSAQVLAAATPASTSSSADAQALLGRLSCPHPLGDALLLLGRHAGSVGRLPLRPLLAAVVHRAAYQALERHRDDGRALAAALGAGRVYDDAAWLRATQRLVARTLMRLLGAGSVDAARLAALADDACRTAFVDALAARLAGVAARTADASAARWHALLRESLDRNQHEVPVLDGISPTGLAHWVDGVSRLRLLDGTRV